VLASEAERTADGAPPRDLTEYTGWRDTAVPANLDLLDFYERYMIGQTSGFSDALSLDAVMAALRIDGVSRREWPEMTRRLLVLHREIVANAPKKG